MSSIPKGEQWQCPECSRYCAFSQHRRHLKTRHPGTDLKSVLERTDAPLAKRGHIFKRGNRSRRFRRKPSDQQQKTEPSNKTNGCDSSGSEEALVFKTVDRHPPSTTTDIASQPELVMWIPVNPVEDRVDGQRTLRVAVPAASDGRFPWLSKYRLERHRDSLGEAFVYKKRIMTGTSIKGSLQWNCCAIIASARSSSSPGVLSGTAGESQSIAKFPNCS